MIVAIDGKVVKKEPMLLHIKCEGGLTYKVSASLFTTQQCTLGSHVELHTTQIIREDASILFGFWDVGEQQIFERLIKLTGVGPATANAICSTLSTSEFATAIATNDINAFKRVPGIGPKAASRIMVELSDFRVENSFASYINDAILALESLGFKREKVQSVVTVCTSTDTASLVKEALKKLT